MMKLYASGEDYLEAILVLKNKLGIHNADALATSDQVRIENISANQKFEAFITSLAHIVEKYGMKVLNEGDGAA